MDFENSQWRKTRLTQIEWGNRLAVNNALSRHGQITLTDIEIQADSFLYVF